ncbi:MAG: sigma-70 family RNA polymerase sigma factor [Myxococcales bacterium]
MIEAHARQAWRELREQLRPYVARRVHSSAIDDVLQETFLRLQRGLPTLREEDRFGPWVYRVARSAIADHGRRVARAPRSWEGSDETVDPRLDVQAGEEVEALLAAQLGRFVALLPTPQREALTLVELRGLTLREAAELLGVTPTCAKSRVQRGRARLRELLELCCRMDLDARGRPLTCEPRTESPLAQGCACQGSPDAKPSRIAAQALRDGEN